MFRHWVGKMTGLLSIVLAVMPLVDPGLFSGDSGLWRTRWLWWIAAAFSFFIASRLAWDEQRKKKLLAETELAHIEKKHFDERPQIGMEIHGREGPTAWISAYSHDVCVFTLSQISGRTAQSLRFDPIQSKGGRFVLTFDPVPFLDPSPRSTPLRYEISEPPHHPLSGADREKMGDMEGKLLYLFLVDSPPELPQLEYVLTVRFRDRDEMRSQTFKIVFETRTYRFLPVAD